MKKEKGKSIMNVPGNPIDKPDLFSMEEILTEFGRSISSIIARLPGEYGLNARQTNALVAAAQEVTGELNKPHAPPRPGMGVDAWLACDETGRSAEFMCWAIFGKNRESGYKVAEFYYDNGIPKNYAPCGIDDFRRCMWMLDACLPGGAESSNQSRYDLVEHHMSQRGAIWRELANSWSTLESMLLEKRPTRDVNPEFMKIMKNIHCGELEGEETYREEDVENE